jgi:hypothetical protein
VALLPRFLTGICRQGSRPRCTGYVQVARALYGVVIVRTDRRLGFLALHSTTETFVTCYLAVPLIGYLIPGH